jgi:hypothetical protein
MADKSTTAPRSSSHSLGEVTMPRLIINAVAPAAGCETLNMSMRTVASSSDTPIAPARAPLTSATPACWCISPKAARAPAPPATPQACPPMALRGAAEGASGIEKIKKALAPIGGYTKGSPVARPRRASKVTATAPANRAVRRALPCPGKCPGRPPRRLGLGPRGAPTSCRSSRIAPRSIRADHRPLPACSETAAALASLPSATGPNTLRARTYGHHTMALVAPDGA